MRTRAVIVASITLTLVSPFIFPSAAGASSASRPPRSYFGMHFVQPENGLPDTPTGSIRLWDIGTDWRSLEPARGQFDFSRLDAVIANAKASGQSVDLVLGQTPQWAAADPSLAGMYGSGATSPPAIMTYWREYVRAVVKHCRGRVGAYEVWNEWELGTFWLGTTEQMVALSRVAKEVIDKFNPKAIVTSPSITIRSKRSVDRLVEYARVGGLRYADVVSVHAYPDPNSGPERSVALVEKVRHRLAHIGIHKPLWNTEVNYGLPWGGNGPRVPLSTDQQSAYVARTYLLNWAHDIGRVYWYSWAAAPFMGVQLTQSGSTAMAAPGSVLAVVRRWMSGSMGKCPHSRSGTYHCVIYYPHGRGDVYWNPYMQVRIAAPSGAVLREGVYGHLTATHGGSKIRVGFSPVLFRSKY